MLGHECRHGWLVPDSMRFPGERGVERTRAMRMPQRRFPAPWSVEESDACFIVRDHGRQALAYVYFEEEPGRRAVKHPHRDAGIAYATPS